MAAPTYKNPTYKNAYIKLLAYLNNHPGLTLEKCIAGTFGYQKNFDTFKTLVNFGFIDLIDPNVKFKTHMKFRISKYGKMLLEEAAWSKPVYDLVDFADKCKAENAEILSMQITHSGLHLQERDFIMNIVTTIMDHPLCKKHVYASIPYFDEFVKLATET